MGKGFLGALVLAFVLAGCVQDPPPSAFQALASKKADSRSPAPQQAGADHAGCRSDANKIADANQPAPRQGEYDLFKSMFASEPKPNTTNTGAESVPPEPAPRQGEYDVFKAMFADHHEDSAHEADKRCAP